MPFTLAHPAAVLPLLRTPLVPAALVAGSLAPDVPYFLRVPRSAQSWYEPFVNATLTHGWPGILTLAVPTAALLLLAWALVRAPALDLVELRVDAGRAPHPAEANGPAPEPGLSERSATGSPVALRTRGAWVLVSLTVGVLTHVGWDSFTHADGVVVQNVPFLQAPAVSGMATSRVLQHLSTVVGLLVLVLWATRRAARWRASGGRLRAPLRARVLLTCLVLVTVSVAAIRVVAWRAEEGPLENLLSDLVTDTGAAAVVVVATYALLWHLRAARRPVGP